jgi:hypothetical protein
MAWEYDEEEVNDYIDVLKGLRYIEANAPKTGADNYIFMIDTVKEYVKEKQKKLQLVLNLLNDRMMKIEYIVEKLDADLTDRNLDFNFQIFVNNAQTITNPDDNDGNYMYSADMEEVNDNIISTAGEEYTRLKSYKREDKELIAKYFDIKSQITFFKDSENILNTIKAKLSA